jgi:hypothetical protein
MLLLGLLSLPLLGPPAQVRAADADGLSAEEQALLEEIDLLLELEMLEAWDAIEDPGDDDVASEDPEPEPPPPARARPKGTEDGQ